MNLWFFFEDVEAGREDFAAVEGLDEGCFVHDSSSGRVDDYDAVFHFAEFGGADYVAGVFLLGYVSDGVFLSGDKGLMFNMSAWKCRGESF